MDADQEETRPLVILPGANEPLKEEASRDSSPSTIARYRVVRKIGQGGFGEVYSAFDPDLKRHVAIKLIRGIKHLSPRETEEFHQEARVLASLDHLGIVPIYDSGLHLGQPYFVMKLVEGRSLASLVSVGDGLEESEVLRLAVQILEALAYAHRQGVLHRDVKPQTSCWDPMERRQY